MPRRNSPNEIHDLGDLSRLGEIVFDKRLGQRAIAKKIGATGIMKSNLSATRSLITLRLKQQHQRI